MVCVCHTPIILPPTILSDLLVLHNVRFVCHSWYFYNNWVISWVLANWLRAMAQKSGGHRNDVMLGHFFVVIVLYFILFYFIIFSFPYLAKSIFQETSTKINTKNCQCYCKNKSTTILLSTLLPTIEVKSKFSQLCSETTRLQLSFKHLFSCQ